MDDLTREQRFEAIDDLEGWQAALRQVSVGTLVIFLVLFLMEELLRALCIVVVYWLFRLAAFLVRTRSKLHTRKLGLTK